MASIREAAVRVESCSLGYPSSFPRPLQREHEKERRPKKAAKNKTNKHDH